MKTDTTSKLLFTSARLCLALVLLCKPMLAEAKGGKPKNSYVNLFMGTGGDNGQLDPGAAVPYSMIRVCPDSDPRNHGGYDYNQTKTTGFTINRLSGIGCSGAGGNIRLRPAPKNESLYLLKESEQASPGYYTVDLSNGVRAQLTATQNSAYERFHYPKGQAAVMTFDVGASFTKILDAQYDLVSDTEITGYIHAGNTCDHGAYKLYFSMTTSQAFTIVSQHERVVELAFANTKAQPIDIRIAVSPISVATAQRENSRVKKLSFDKVRLQAEAAWESTLAKVEVTGGTEEAKTLFYTSLYRTFLSPANTTSATGEYLATNGNTYNTKDTEGDAKKGFTYYSSWSMWDSYRTKFPLLTLLDADKMQDFCNSLCKLYVYGKRDWATPFESTPTVRTEHTVVVLLDAYNKGITGIHLEEAYTGLRAEVDGLRAERPDQAFETCIDLWAMSQIADIVGQKADAEMYKNKADSLFKTTWEKEFAHINDSFGKMRDSGLYQGTRWQYRWALPQYLALMEASVGGREQLVKELDYFFSHSLNNQGNETGIHAPFIYNRLGEPVKAQNIVTQIRDEEMTHLYGGNGEYPTPYIGKIFKPIPEGYLPEMDEDDGTMSAWYVFASIGLFPLVVGDPYYEITSPAFDSITIKVGSKGETFVVKSINRRTGNSPIQKVYFNGQELSDYRIHHRDVAKGGLLELVYW